MLDKKLVLMLYSNDHTQAEISRIMGVTRERIHQIVTDYAPFYRNKRILKRMKKGCTICRGEATLIHHIDYDRRNHISTNLMPLCHLCHVEVHLSSRTKRLRNYTYKPFKSNFTRKNGRWSKNYLKCIICRENTRIYGGKGLCSACYQIYQREKNRKEEKELL